MNKGVDVLEKRGMPCLPPSERLFPLSLSSKAIGQSQVREAIFSGLHGHLWLQCFHAPSPPPRCRHVARAARVGQEFASLIHAHIYPFLTARERAELQMRPSKRKPSTDGPGAPISCRSRPPCGFTAQEVVSRQVIWFPYRCTGFDRVGPPQQLKRD
ncbi:hypothetical protein GQ53DRAFT_413796 [Thozetella sp. PMI_491]|nr:hypothetical protein GQ53DRAFT_413796 [Thozetella sp. PMI_491]